MVFFIIIFCFFIFIPAGNCTTGDARLVNGSTRYEGTVQVCIGGVWGTVCDTYWSEYDGRVVCRQLGYSTAGKGDIRLHKDDYYRALTQNNNIVFLIFSNYINMHSIENIMSKLRSIKAMYILMIV